jgi:hypothetical protein
MERLRPNQEVNAVATEQVGALLGRLEAGGTVPLFVFDAGYDLVKLQRGLEKGARARSSCACERGAACTATRASRICLHTSDAPPPRVEDEVLRSRHLALAIGRASLRGWRLRIRARAGAGPCCGPEAAVGALLRCRTADACTGPPGCFGASGHARQGAQTLWAFSGAAQRRLSGGAKRYPAVKKAA